ncbi:MAG: hypothetical protein J5529_10785 [Prevotella sp.]|nr:hypothetical protein [Prevotella sp.]
MTIMNPTNHFFDLFLSRTQVNKERRVQLFASAVSALVEMGNNSYQRHLNQEQADSIEAFILFDGGERKQLCDEIWNEAITSIRNGWRDGTHDALEELRTGKLYGQSYSNGIHI